MELRSGAEHLTSAREVRKIASVAVTQPATKINRRLLELVKKQVDILVEMNFKEAILILQLKHEGGELPPEAETTTAGIDNQEGFEEDIADDTTPNADIESYGEQEEGSESEAPGETTTTGPDDLTTTEGSDNETENPEDHGEDEEEYEEYGDDAEYEEDGGHDDDAGDTEYSDEEYVEPGEDSPDAGSSENDPDVQEYSEEVYEEYEEPPSDEKVVSGKADAVESDYYNMPNYLEEYHEPEF